MVASKCVLWVTNRDILMPINCFYFLHFDHHCGVVVSIKTSNSSSGAPTKKVGGEDNEGNMSSAQGLRGSVKCHRSKNYFCEYIFLLITIKFPVKWHIKYCTYGINEGRHRKLFRSCTVQNS